MLYSFISSNVIQKEAPHIVTMIPGNDYKKQKPTKNLNVLMVNNKEQTLMLRGIIYWENRNHFVSRIITPDSMVWYNDGITTGRGSIYEGQLTTIRDLTERDGSRAVTYIYGKP